jgi:hypothetical protein
MKKAKTSNRGSVPKAKGAPKNVDEYFAGVPEPARSALSRMREAIRSSVPLWANFFARREDFARRAGARGAWWDM